MRKLYQIFLSAAGHDTRKGQEGKEVYQTEGAKRLPLPYTDAVIASEWLLRSGFECHYKVLLSLVAEDGERDLIAGLRVAHARL